MEKKKNPGSEKFGLDDESELLRDFPYRGI